MANGDGEGAGRAPAQDQFGVFAALSYPKYLRIWSAQFVAQIGFWMLVTARAVLVFDITGSTAALGLIYFFTFIPALVLGPFSGVVADRYDRRHILIGTQIIRAVGSFALGVLAATDTATLLNLAVISLALGSVQTFNGPAANALMPALVDREALTSAVTLNSVLQNASRIVGPLLAAAMIPTLGLESLFYANALAAVVIVVAWALTPAKARVGAVVESAVKSFGRGLRLVSRAPDLWVPILMVAVLSFFGLIYQPLSVALVTDTLADGDADRGAALYGIFQSTVGVGAVIGVVGTGRTTTRWPANSLMFTAVAFSLSLMLLGLTDLIGVALVAALLIGAFHFAQLTIAMNLVQHQVSEAYRGRAMSIYALAFVGLFPFSSFISGALASQIGVGTTLLAGGVVCLIFSLYALRWRKYVHMDGPAAREARSRHEPTV